jgi:hypothetical protein
MIKENQIEFHFPVSHGDEHFLRFENRSADDLRNLLQLGRFQEAPDRRANWPNIAALLVWLPSAGTLLVGV